MKTPDRWLDYKPAGKQIENTPFVALKCPLKEDILKNLPVESRFGIIELKESLPNLALIIDLTNTDRYYNPEDLRNFGIEHKKIKVPGHEVPKHHLIKRFFCIVNDFMHRNATSGKNNLIGVHCTHGVNRTGFFICSYMISVLAFSFEMAVSEFNSARGHDMERQNYIGWLKKCEKHPLKFAFKLGNFSFQRTVDSYWRRKERPRSRKKNSKPLCSVTTRVPPIRNPNNYFTGGYRTPNKNKSPRGSTFVPTTESRHDVDNLFRRDCFGVPVHFTSVKSGYRRNIKGGNKRNFNDHNKYQWRTHKN